MITTQKFVRSFEVNTEDVSPKRRTVTARINTGCVDRYRTVIQPSGGDWSNFMRSGPAVLWEHGNDPVRGRSPVAHCSSIKYRRVDDDLLSVMQFKTDEFSSQLLDHYSSGTLRSFSIEFLPDEARSGRPTTDEVRSNPEWGQAHTIYRAWEMTGVSAVSYPGNPEALALAVERGLWVPEETRRALADLGGQAKPASNDDDDDDDNDDDEISLDEAKEKDSDEFDGLEIAPDEVKDSDEELDERSLGSSLFLILPRYNPNHDPHTGEFSLGSGPGGGKKNDNIRLPSNMKGPGTVKITLTPRVTIHKRSDGGIQFNHEGKAVAWSQPSKTGKYWLTAKPTGQHMAGKGIHTTKSGSKTEEVAVYSSKNRREKAANRAKEVAQSFRENNTSDIKEKFSKDASKFNINDHIDSKTKSSYSVIVEFIPKSIQKKDSPSPYSFMRSASINDNDYDDYDDDYDRSRIKKIGDEWGVYSGEGELLGKHKTKAEAVQQLQAIYVHEAKEAEKSKKKSTPISIFRLRTMAEGSGSQGGYTIKVKAAEEPDDSEPDEDEDDENDRYIKHEGSKWIVYSEAGKVLGKHDSKADAVAQLQAIEANKHKKEAPSDLERAYEARIAALEAHIGVPTDKLPVKADDGLDRHLSLRGDFWVVHAEDGSELGEHATKEEAIAQLRSIEAAMAKPATPYDSLPRITTFTMEELASTIVDSVLPITQAIIAHHVSAFERSLRDRDELARGRV